MKTKQSRTGKGRRKNGVNRWQENAKKKVRKRGDMKVKKLLQRL